MYVNLVNCLNTSNLIILSHPLQPVSELGQLLECFFNLTILSHLPQFVRELGHLSDCLSNLINLSHPPKHVRELDQLSECLSYLIILSYLSRMYVNLVDCLNTSNLIILSHFL